MLVEQTHLKCLTMENFSRIETLPRKLETHQFPSSFKYSIHLREIKLNGIYPFSRAFLKNPLKVIPLILILIDMELSCSLPAIYPYTTRGPVNCSTEKLPRRSSCGNFFISPVDDPIFAAIIRLRPDHTGHHWSIGHLSHEKYPALVFIMLVAFFGDPYNGIFQAPYNWVV